MRAKFVLRLKPGARRGQGSMEYMLTYAVGLFIVFTVSIALYRIGIFDSHGQGYYADDFGALSPQIATCGVTENTVFGLNEQGFSCGFINTHGVTIYIERVRVFYEDKHGSQTQCTWSVAGLEQKADRNDYASYSSTTGPLDECYDIAAGGGALCPYDHDGDGKTEFPVEKNQHFVVSGIDFDPEGSCAGINEEAKFRMYYEITYHTVMNRAHAQREAHGTIRYET